MTEANALEFLIDEDGEVWVRASAYEWWVTYLFEIMEDMIACLKTARGNVDKAVANKLRAEGRSE